MATFAGAVLFDEHKVAYLRRDDEAYIPQPADVRALVCAVMYGYDDEVRVGGKRLFRIAREHGARYLGDEISEGDWAARHDRYATPLHGRTKDGQVIPMSWHCEDAAIPYSNVPAVTKAWHEIVADLRRRTDVFDDWGMFAYTSADTGVDYLTEIDVGIWEQRLDDAAWAAWVDAKRQIAAVALANDGSISACHGSCREGEVDLVPAGAGPRLRRDARRQAVPGPEQHHEPRQVPARPGLRGDDRCLSSIRRAPRPPRPSAFAEQSTPPPAERVSDVAQTTFAHVYEVDPRLMQRHVLQQVFPNWDTLRIMNSRQDHLQWMHRHFAHTVVTGSELLAEIEAEETA